MIDILITNKDFGLEKRACGEDCYVRYASRGIVVDPKTNRIAVGVKTKIKEYKLPGGGKEGEETEEETFEREIFEETGCKIRALKRLGIVREERDNINMKQTSTVFVAELAKDTKKLHLTEKEASEGMEVRWMSLAEATEAVRKSYDTVLVDNPEDLYRAHFVIMRDLKILEAYADLLRQGKLAK